MKAQIIYKISLSLCLVMSMFSSGFAQNKKEEPVIQQEEKQLFRKGNDLYNEQNFVDAEVQYKKALEKNPNYEKANYNLGNAIYQQNRYKEALPLYDLSSKLTENQTTKAESFHNAGNVMMKEKQYAQAVESYKNALRNNSRDDETRYNLALAQELLKQEQNKDNKDQKDKDNKDKDKKDQDKKDQDQKDDQNKDKDENGDEKDKDKKGDNDQKNKNEDNKDKEKQQAKPQPNKLTPQQVKQLLEAMSNEENKTQKKVNAQKAKGPKVKQEKDW